MKDKIYYYDHNGLLKLTLNEYPYYSEPSEFKNWSWGYSNQFGRLHTFYRNKEEWPLVIGIANDSVHDHDKLCDIFTEDIMAGQPGKLVLRGWTLRCYITQAEYGYGTYTREMDRQAVFNVRAIDSTWIRETTKEFHGTGGAGPIEDLWRDYVEVSGVPGRGYDYGYNIPIDHDGQFDFPESGSGYKIKFFGPAVDPTIYINNNMIQVNVTLDEGDIMELVANGNEKTIEVTKANGYKYNAFIYRNKEHSPFIELPRHVVLSFGVIRFEFTTIERRSEPTWT